MNNQFLPKSFNIHNILRRILQNKLLLLKLDFPPLPPDLPGKSQRIAKRLSKFLLPKRFYKETITLHVTISRKLLPRQPRFKYNRRIPILRQPAQLLRQISPLIILQLNINNKKRNLILPGIPQRLPRPGKRNHFQLS